MTDDAERDLAELYGAHAAGGPPRAIDEKILAAARSQVERKAGLWASMAAAAIVLGLLLAWRSVTIGGPVPARSVGLAPYGYNEGRAAAYLMGEKFYGAPVPETAGNLSTAGAPGLSLFPMSQQ